jgi:4-hydroxy-tetrahydrodipicolinate synthase
MFQLTSEERLLVIRSVVETSHGLVPVVATGTFSPDMVKCADFIKRVYETGVAAVIVITNQVVDIQESDDIFKGRIELLLKLTGDIPLGLYECPDPYKRLISPEVMHWLGQTGRFIYHKDTSCDPDAIKVKIKAVEGSPLSFYNADTATALISLQSGASGISPIGANFFPELYSLLIDGLNNESAPAELMYLNAQLDVMDTLVDQYYPFSAKLFLQQRGLPITSVCRLPVRRMAPKDILKVQDMMKVLDHVASQFKMDLKITAE